MPLGRPASLAFALLALAGLASPAAADPVIYAVVRADSVPHEAIAPLLAIRQDPGCGLHVVETTVRAAVAWAGRHADSERPAPREAIQAWVRAQRAGFLLLVGDVDAIPAFEVAGCATDRPYADPDDDGLPDLAVGRFPSSDPAVVARIVARTCAYEERRAGGAWRKQCALLAGEGRFGPAADAMIERLFAQVVSDAIPAGYDIDLTYANPRSPYCYPPERFSERVVERLNEGALVCAYVGHGSERSLDDLTIEGRSYPILGVAQAPQVRTDRPAVFLAIACSTGAYDARRGSIGETLLASGRGPVAFFGASRVSHPLPNAILARALVRELFGEGSPGRLGLSLDRARRSLVTDRRDPLRLQVLALAGPFLDVRELEPEWARHVDMYNLLGDPALALARPDAPIELAAVGPGQAGGTLRVRGQVPDAAAGLAVTVTLEVQREREARPDGPEDETRVERYARANDKVVCTVLAATRADGGFEVELALPRALSGRYVLKAFAERGGWCAIGGVPVEVAALPGYDAFEEDVEDLVPEGGPRWH